MQGDFARALQLEVGHKALQLEFGHKASQDVPMHGTLLMHGLVTAHV